MDPSGRPHRGAPCTEETPLRTEEPGAARRSQPPSARRSQLRPASGPAHTLVLPVTAPFLLVVADSSHRRSLGTPKVSHQPLCLRTLFPRPPATVPQNLGANAQPWLSAAVAVPLPTTPRAGA